MNMTFAGRTVFVFSFYSMEPIQKGSHMTEKVIHFPYFYPVNQHYKFANFMLLCLLNPFWSTQLSNRSFCGT